MSACAGGGGESDGSEVEDMRLKVITGAEPTGGPSFRELVVLPTATTYYGSHERLNKIEGLERCRDLESLSLIVSYIPKLEGLDSCFKLRELEISQNLITKIENICHLVNLELLDLSYNKIRIIENLESLTNLKKLYLTNNKITKVEGLATLKQLTYLELGANRIRVIEGIAGLGLLEELWLGKNRITEMTIPPLPHLTKLSLQSNRLTSWGDSLFTSAVGLTELYLSENKLPSIPHTIIARLPNLTVLDLAHNSIQVIPEALCALQQLEDLWLNGNQVASLDDIQPLARMTALRTVYLEHNPLAANLGGGYMYSLVQLMPFLTQLDADEITADKLASPTKQYR